jgi:CobW/HypB/UreG, nucleotide-binding domain
VAGIDETASSRLPAGQQPANSSVVVFLNSELNHSLSVQVITGFLGSGVTSLLHPVNHELSCFLHQLLPACTSTLHRVPSQHSERNCCPGKTTLLNHILSQNHGKKIAVIENEFGDIAIDDALIKGKETLDKDSELGARPEDIELTVLENGCLCCTVREDLVFAVQSLVERGGFDHIVIETTGMTMPTSERLV